MSNLGNISAYLAIPNNIDNTYTGIININANITFYLPDLPLFPSQYLPIVMPLTNATMNSNPFSVMRLNGNQSLSYAINLSENNNFISNLLLDVYISAHGCE